MSYEQFVQKVEDCLRGRIEGDEEICIRTALKNNGKERKGIAFYRAGASVSPTIYLEEFFERFQQGADVEEIAKQLLDLYRLVEKKHSWEGEFIRKYENVEKRIIYQLVNLQANRELLKDMPHIPYLDLAVIFLVLLDVDLEDDRMVTMKIHREHLKMWGISEQMLFENAHKNTEKLLSYVFSPMYAVLDGIAENNVELQGEACEDMYVMTNVLKNFGAAAILYPGRLEGIGCYLGENYYVLPSSVHEVLIIPESRAVSHMELSAIVKEMNETQLQEEEVLSDHAYFYDRDMGKLFLNCTQNDRME